MIFRGARWIMDKGELAVAGVRRLTRGAVGVRAEVLLREIEQVPAALRVESLEAGRRLVRAGR